MLPAVLQLKRQAPCFGIITNISGQELAFDCQTTPPAQQAAGQIARLGFDLQPRHYSGNGRILLIQGTRVLLSLREMPATTLSALRSADLANGQALTLRMSKLQIQQACHTQFMQSMKAVVTDFYRLLSGQYADVNMLPGITRLQHTQNDYRPLLNLKNVLNELRPQISRKLTQDFPMYLELSGSFADSPTELALVDKARLDDWISLTSIAQNLSEPFKLLARKFDLHYNIVLHGSTRQVALAYQMEAVLHVLADMLEPFKLKANEYAFCYELMGQAFQEHATALYLDMLDIVGDLPPETIQPPRQTANLEQYLKMSASETAATGGTSGAKITDQISSMQTGNLAALLSRLAESLGNLERLPAPAPQASASLQTSALATNIPPPVNTPVQGLLARDRVFSHFLPANAELAGKNSLFQASPTPVESGTIADSVTQISAGLADADLAALLSLQAIMRQPPPLDPGPERLSHSSQIRPLILQAQGLLLEFTLHGLTYQSQPNHPAWTLINALDALHQGADNHGQFLDQALHHAISLSMQWLLGEEDVDAALAQINNLLANINAQLREDRQLRRARHLASLAPLDSDPSLVNSGWCVIKLGEEAIPYEILGMRDGKWMLLDRSATDLLEISTEAFKHGLDSGDIEEADDFDLPFLERIADATLAASLEAVHTYTWQDPATGCLKRTALMDELERRLAHPVTEPPTFCALLEIPGMRPGPASLPADQLSLMQKRTGEILQDMCESGEQCGRLSDISFLMIFAPQDAARLAGRLSQLKLDIESLHPDWKMSGAAVPLVETGEASPAPSSVLRHADMACAPQRQPGGFDLSCLHNAGPITNQITPLPFSSLYLRCQKIAPCSEGGAAHYEILLGVNEGLVPGHTTQSFVVMAEQSGHIHDLDIWVLQTTLEWMDCNPTGLEQLSGVSINLSGGSLAQPGHTDSMLDLLARYPHLTQKIIFEVTETVAINNLEVAARSLRRLRKLGCRIALDDFGSGYSSYGYLRSLPLDYLKIDGTYIRNILTDKTDQALTASMVDVAHALGLKVIAEFVGSEAASTLLKTLGVDYVQGYWIHKPERLDGLKLS